MKDIFIEVKEVSKNFSNSSSEDQAYALQKINLQIFKGDIYGIIGMSGAGKSTLMRCLIGLEFPTVGSILFNGEEINQKSTKKLCAIRKQMGVVFQYFHLFLSKTVAENITYPLEIHGVPKKACQRRVDELLNLVNLSDKKDAYPSQLSGGQKQRVSIARALANNPQILFCDEPTSALDPQTTRSLLQLLVNLNRTLGLTIVIITHQLEVIKQICNRVAVLEKGEVAEEGNIKDIFINPTQSATRHLLNHGRDQIPKQLLSLRDPNKKLVRLGFMGHQANEPIISHMIKRHAVEANILSGGLDYLQQTIIGNLIVELSGSPTDIQDALTFLRSRQINCEVIP